MKDIRDAVGHPAVRDNDGWVTFRTDLGEVIETSLFAVKEVNAARRAKGLPPLEFTISKRAHHNE